MLICRINMTNGAMSRFALIAPFGLMSCREVLFCFFCVGCILLFFLFGEVGDAGGDKQIVP